MIALLTSTVLPLLFAGSGTFGIAVLAASWRRHGGAFARLRAELAACGEAGELIARIAVSEPVARPRPAVSATGLRRPARAPLRGVRSAGAGRPVPAGLRAAA